MSGPSKVPLRCCVVGSAKLQSSLTGRDRPGKPSNLRKNTGTERTWMRRARARAWRLHATANRDLRDFGRLGELGHGSNQKEKRRAARILPAPCLEKVVPAQANQHRNVPPTSYQVGVTAPLCARALALPEALGGDHTQLKRAPALEIPPNSGRAPAPAAR